MSYYYSNTTILEDQDIRINANWKLMGMAAGSELVLLCYDVGIEAYAIDGDRLTYLCTKQMGLIGSEVHSLHDIAIVERDNKGISDYVILAYYYFNGITTVGFDIDEMTESDHAVSTTPLDIDIDVSSSIYAHSFDERVLMVECPSIEPSHTYYVYSKLMDKYIAASSVIPEKEVRTVFEISKSNNHHELKVSEMDCRGEVAKVNKADLIDLRHLVDESESNQSPISASYEDLFFYRYYVGSSPMLGVYHYGIVKPNQDPHASDTPYKLNIDVSGALDILSFRYRSNTYMLVLVKGEIHVYKIELHGGNMLFTKIKSHPIDPLITSACIAIQGKRTYTPIVVFGGSYNQPLAYDSFEHIAYPSPHRILSQEYSLVSEYDAQFIKENKIRLQVERVGRLETFLIKDNSKDGLMKLGKVDANFEMTSGVVTCLGTIATTPFGKLEVFGMDFEIIDEELVSNSAAKSRVIITHISDLDFEMQVIFVDAAVQSKAISIPVHCKSMHKHRVSIDPNQYSDRGVVELTSDGVTVSLHRQITTVNLDEHSTLSFSSIENGDSMVIHFEKICR